MRILLMGASYLARDLRALGHEVAEVGRGTDASLQLDHPVYTGRLWQRLEGFEPDALVYLDDGNLPVLINPQDAPCPAIYYSIDTYCNPWHICYAHGFDLILVAQKDFIPLFSNDGLRTLWFPLFNILDFPPHTGARDIPVSFVGTLGHRNNPDREPFLREFRSFQPLVMLRGDYRPIFTRSQIVLNQTAFSELNFRCFEAMACGAALLMEQCGNGLTDLFTPGKNILPPYPRNNARVAAAIAREYLGQPELLERIAAAGRELVARDHTAAARAATLARLCAKLAGDTGRERQKLAPERMPHVRAAFGMIGAELTAPALAAHRDFYLKLGGALER